MITEISIKHYKSISSLDVKLGNLNVCIGKNASGKSNFLDAISFLADIASEGMDTAISKRHGVNSVCQWSKTKPYDTTIYVKLAHERLGFGSYRLTFSSKNDEYIIKSEVGAWTYNNRLNRETEPRKTRVSFSRNAEGEVTLKGDKAHVLFRQNKPFSLQKSESFLHRLSGVRSLYGRLAIISNVIASTKIYKIYPNIVRKPELPSSMSSLENDGGNICRVFKTLSADTKRNRSNRRNIITSLRHAMPHLENIRIRSLGEWYVPNFSVYDDETKTKFHNFNTSQISDGTLRMFALLVALYQPNPPDIICIEEPEQNINPALLSVLSEAIIDVASHTQLFVSTHSPQMLDDFPLDSMIAFQFKDGVTQAGKIEKEQVSIVKKGLMSLGELSVADNIRLAR